MGSRTRLALMPAIVLVAGCDRAMSLSASNQSSRTYLLRYQADLDLSDSDIPRKPAVWTVPPASAGIAIPRAIGELSATVELLDANCRVLQSWRTTSGGEVFISSSGVVGFDPQKQSRPEGGSLLEPVPRCGGDGT